LSVREDANMAGDGRGKSLLESERERDIKFALWCSAILFGALGFGFTVMTIMFARRDVEVILTFLSGAAMMFGAMGYSLFRMRHVNERKTGEDPGGAFACAHCGKRFSKRKYWEGHQRTCVEMRI